MGPLVGKPHNSQSFMEKIQSLEVPVGQKLISFDVSVLFSSIPVIDAVKAIEEKVTEKPCT